MDSLSAPLYVPYDLTPFFLGQWEHMTVQHWGVLAGVVTYCLTVTVVVVLLILGGTCTRLREQAEAFESVGKAAFAAPFERFQLYDELLDAARTLPLKPTLPDRKAESDLDESKLNESQIEVAVYDMDTLSRSDLFKHFAPTWRKIS